LRYSKLPQIRIQLFGYIFSPKWFPTLMTAMLLPLLISLGLWQLQRAEEKRHLEREFAAQTLPLNIQAAIKIKGQQLRYRRLHVTGFFDNAHVMFLDNQIHKRQVGLHVITPFIVANNHVRLLVDRGFIASNNRTMLPIIKKVTGLRTLTGLIYLPSRKFVLKKEILRQHWPLLLQAIDLQALQNVLNEPIYPFYLLLQNGDDVKLVRDWHPVNFPSYRHKGYALQWFALATLLVLIFLCLNISKVSERQS
jgi:surfeit locus 1 family protein